MTDKELLPGNLYQAITTVIQLARQHVKQVVNHQMVSTYWEIGRLIVEHEQQGQARAVYGKQQLQQLSKRLTDEFGKGFDARNLRNMRMFYQQNPIWNAVRSKLSWTHCNVLIRIENSSARMWYA
ncbi:DUF1016 N-terminal domain-containing protein [Marinomonas sp. 15G1-11]|uniref:DUF1016 N-terminal domain-containing protein n=1 Tax=Marinomonas phaeophyticola TaxID=3004091 RepID=A0ABT4JVR0_9GAMM|nr:DUF1016 N-terminal domain-containing protein [Marinomonas sp. 15G1-11]MCZ2722398.1 DUF1016 N-terminal domain-containing protein [Marinomonas sp. 15G1-11]